MVELFILIRFIIIELITFFVYVLFAEIHRFHYRVVFCLFTRYLEKSLTDVGEILLVGLCHTEEEYLTFG